MLRHFIRLRSPCRRHLTTNAAANISKHSQLLAMPQLIDMTNDPGFPVNDLLIKSDFISSAEHNTLVGDVDRLIRRNRLKYQPSHFDSVIKNYRELPASDDKWSPGSREVFVRMRRTIADELIRKTVSSTDFSDPNSQQSIDTDALWQVAGGWKTMHILDLNADGEIGAHVDHRDYSGRLVSALCLLSTAVVRFTHTGDSGRFVDVLLRPGTLYGHTGKARFDYKHSIVAQQAQQYEFQGMRFPQKRRVSLMLRSCK